MGYLVFLKNIIFMFSLIKKSINMIYLCFLKLLQFVIWRNTMIFDRSFKYFNTLFLLQKYLLIFIKKNNIKNNIKNNFIKKSIDKTDLSDAINKEILPELTDKKYLLLRRRIEEVIHLYTDLFVKK